MWYKIASNFNLEFLLCFPIIFKQIKTVLPTLIVRLSNAIWREISFYVRTPTGFWIHGFVIKSWMLFLDSISTCSFPFVFLKIPRISLNIGGSLIEVTVCTNMERDRSFYLDISRIWFQVSYMRLENRICKRH